MVEEDKIQHLLQCLEEWVYESWKDTDRIRLLSEEALHICLDKNIKLPNWVNSVREEIEKRGEPLYVGIEYKIKNISDDKLVKYINKIDDEILEKIKECKLRNYDIDSIKNRIDSLPDMFDIALNELYRRRRSYADDSAKRCGNMLDW